MPKRGAIERLTLPKNQIFCFNSNKLFGALMKEDEPLRYLLQRQSEGFDDPAERKTLADLPMADRRPSVASARSACYPGRPSLIPRLGLRIRRHDGYR